MTPPVLNVLKAKPHKFCGTFCCSVVLRTSLRVFEMPLGTPSFVVELLELVRVEGKLVLKVLV